MPTPFERVTLIRLHESLWSYSVAEKKAPSTNEIRLQTPHWVAAEKAYRLAHFATQHLDQAQFACRCDLTFETVDRALAGRWKIVWQKENFKFFHRILQWFPFTRMIASKKIAHIHILPADQNTEISVKKMSQAYAEMPHQTLQLSHSLETKKRLFSLSFTDPFTKLAALAFQTIETIFQAERKIKGSFRFVLDDKDILHLVPIASIPSEKEKQENKKAVAAFQDFAISEYGKENVHYIEQAYGFYFSQMIERGEALLPDHIFKTNIGANTFLLSHIELFYEKLAKTHAKRKLDLQEFSVRELRGIVRGVGSPKALLNLLGKKAPASFKQLSCQQASAVISLFMPTAEERELAYTGRKIRHRAIWGWSEDDECQRENPAADLFELLHLFSDLEKSKVEHYYELIAHVVAKKNLFASYIVDDKIVIFPGLLLPAPYSDDGNKRWYYSEAIVSDQEGNFNYVLLGASPAFDLPMIKLYRNTVSECNNIDWLGSIKADLNPYGSPGPLSPDKASNYEKADIESRSLALWAGYLVMYQKLKEQDEKRALVALRYALVEYMRAPFTKEAMPQLCGKEAIYHFLLAEAEQAGEMPHQKIASDIAFVGHSLGATLSEYYLAKTPNRIPIPGHSFICYSANAPAIDDALDIAFMEFGRRHKVLFETLKCHYKIIRQFEYGDIFAQGGGTHLGTSGYRDDDAVWLDEQNYVFKPHDEAEALAITTLPTHGRRMGGAIQDQDYTLVPISPSELYEFDHAWWLSSDLQKIFGFRILQSPEFTERFRKLVGRLMQPLFAVWEKKNERVSKKIVNRDEKGVLYARYQGIVYKSLTTAVQASIPQGDSIHFGLKEK